MTSITTDDIFNQLKPFGRIQKLVLVTTMYTYFFLGTVDQSIVFLGATPEHHCTVDEGYTINQTIPFEENESGGIVYSECEEYVDPDNPNASETQDCQNGWNYSNEVYGETIITEWDLVCQPNPAAEASQSVLQIGGMVGAIVFGKVADSYGRRPSSLISLIIYNLSLAVVCLSPNFGTFLVMRFFAGIGLMGFYVTMAVTSSEYMVPEYRRLSTTLSQLAVSFGLMFMALMAFLIPDWRFFTLAIFSPILLATFGIWFLPESLRWLISKDKSEEVVALVRRLSKINGTDIPTTMYDKGNSEERQGLPPEIFDTSETNYSQPENDANNADFQTDVNESVTYKQNGMHFESSNAHSDKRNPSDGTCFPISESVPVVVQPQQVSGEKNVTPCDGDESQKDTPDPQGQDSECLDDTNPDDLRVDGIHVKTDTKNIDQYPPDSRSLEFSSAMSDISGNTEKQENITNDKEVRSSSYMELFKPPVLHVTIVMSIFRFTLAIVYFGFALNTGRLEGNPYVNFFLSALVEIPAKLLALGVYKWFRRPYIVCVCYSGCFIALTATVFTPNETKNGASLGSLIVVLSLAGKFFVTLSMTGLLLLIMELFPTTLRNIGNGLTLCVGRIGGMLIPFALYADSYIENFSASLMALMSLVTAVIVLTLPDTRTAPQPQNAQDLRDLFNTKKSNEKQHGTENASFNPNEETQT